MAWTVYAYIPPKTSTYDGKGSSRNYYETFKRFENDDLNRREAEQKAKDLVETGPATYARVERA